MLWLVTAADGSVVVGFHDVLGVVGWFGGRWPSCFWSGGGRLRGCYLAVVSSKVFGSVVVSLAFAWTLIIIGKIIKESY